MPLPLDPVRGRLIVATPDLEDPNFDGTVVLLLEHGPSGSLGVVLNRPSTLAVIEAMGEGPGAGEPSWQDLAGDPGVMFVGGPVQPNAIIALARAAQVTDPERWEQVFADVGVIKLDEGSMAAMGPLLALRVFAGYAGWSPGQLEREIAIGSWFVVEPTREDCFAERPEQLWRTVLQRQGGLFTTVTDNPVLN